MAVTAELTEASEEAQVWSKLSSRVRVVERTCTISICLQAPTGGPVHLSRLYCDGAANTAAHIETGPLLSVES